MYKQINVLINTKQQKWNETKKKISNENNERNEIFFVFGLI